MTSTIEKQFNYKKLLDRFPLITDIYKKCKRFTSSLFNSYGKINYDNVYAIGDIHGDYNALKQILLFIKCIINDNGIIKWNPLAINICIVQVGDILDGYRPGIEISENYKSRDIDIINLLLSLNDEAKQYNSRIILLYGNHEINGLFNIIDDIKLSNYQYSIKNYTIENAVEFNKRMNLLKDRILCEYHSVAIVNDYIFCHSGLILKIIKNLLELFEIPFNEYIQLEDKDKLYLINICATGLLNFILTNGTKTDEYINQYKYILLQLFQHREYKKIIYPIKDLNLIDKNMLKNNTNASNMLLNTKGMVIGHNIILNYKINNLENILYGIDNKISEGFGDINDYYQILKIEKDKEPEIINVLNYKFNKDNTIQKSFFDLSTHKTDLDKKVDETESESLLVQFSDNKSIKKVVSDFESEHNQSSSEKKVVDVLKKDHIQSHSSEQPDSQYTLQSPPPSPRIRFISIEDN